MTKIFTLLFLLSFKAAFALERDKPIVENLLTKDRGFVTCTGGTSAPLFNRECKEITISRISGQGSIKYEGKCVDSNEKTYFIACDAFVLEYERILPTAKGDYGE